MNIVFIEGDDAHGRIDLAHWLQNKGHQVSMYASQGPKRFENTGIPYTQIRINRELNPYADLKGVKALRKILKTLPQDTIVHAFHTKQTLYLPFAAGRLSNVKVVCTITGMGRVFSGKTTKHKILQRVYDGIQRSAKSKIDYTVFQNTDNYKYFLKKELVSPHTSKVIKSSGILLEKFQEPVPLKTQDRLKEELQINPDLPTAIFVGRMVQEKGVLDFLEAAKRINAEKKQANFLLVGPLDTKAGVPLSEIDKYAPFVAYLGRRKDVKELLSLSDIFVLPTYYGEGIPRVLLEASAMKLALVSTDMPGCNDVVLDGKTGLLTKIKDPADVAAKIEDLIRHPEKRKAMQKNAFAHVHNFTLEKVAQDMLEVYHQVLSNK